MNNYTFSELIFIIINIESFFTVVYTINQEMEYLSRKKGRSTNQQIAF